MENFDVTKIEKKKYVNFVGFATEAQQSRHD
jgi:hypothetical protein